MRQRALALTAMLLALAGCDVDKAGKPVEAPVAAVPVQAAPLGVGTTAAALDATTAAEKAAALAAPKGGAHKIGSAVVALGNPAEQGFWLKSALIVVAGKGHVVTETGASIAVDLLPGEGAALLSLAAFRALGLGLTDLTEVTIYAD